MIETFEDLVQKERANFYFWRSEQDINDPNIPKTFEEYVRKGQIANAVCLLEIIDMAPVVKEEFEKNQTVFKSNEDGEICNPSEEEMDLIRAFEKEHNLLVFHIAKYENTLALLYTDTTWSWDYESGFWEDKIDDLTDYGRLRCYLKYLDDDTRSGFKYCLIEYSDEGIWVHEEK